MEMRLYYYMNRIYDLWKFDAVSVKRNITSPTCPFIDILFNTYFHM